MFLEKVPILDPKNEIPEKCAFFCKFWNFLIPEFNFLKKWKICAVFGSPFFQNVILDAPFCQKNAKKWHFFAFFQWKCRENGQKFWNFENRLFLIPKSVPNFYPKNAKKWHFFYFFQLFVNFLTFCQLFNIFLSFFIKLDNFYVHIF